MYSMMSMNDGLKNLFNFLLIFLKLIKKFNN